jgi:hypothetical protein
MRFRLTGNYGTFVITKVVDVKNADEAHALTGIMTDLQEAGWTITDWPDGEEWDIVVVGR